METGTGAETGTPSHPDGAGSEAVASGGCFPSVHKDHNERRTSWALKSEVKGES